MKVFESYGILSHEKTAIYSTDKPASEHYNVLELALPQGWAWVQNGAGETLVEAPDGAVYLPQHVIVETRDAGIALVGHDANGAKFNFALSRRFFHR